MNRMERVMSRFARDAGGSAAVETAFVLPLAIVLIVGTINLGQLASVINGMHFAVEEAARCSAVNVGLCGTPQATVTYAHERYIAPGGPPEFVATSSACGRTVTATHEYELSFVLGSVSVPLSATACFPAST